MRAHRLGSWIVTTVNFSLLLLILLFGVSSCDSDSGTVDGGEDGDVACECQFDFECSSGLVCDGCSCVTTQCDMLQGDECARDTDCNDGFICQEPQCACVGVPDGDSDTTADGDGSDDDTGTTDCNCESQACAVVNLDRLEWSATEAILGVARTKSLHITNNGGAVLEILSVQVSKESSSDFELVEPETWNGAQPVKLQPQQESELTVKLTPSVPGPIDGTLEIITNDACDPRKEVALVKVYKGTTVIHVSPLSYDYSTVEIGSEAVPMQVSISNIPPEIEREDTNKVLSIFGIRLDPPESKQGNFFLPDNLPDLQYINPMGTYQFNVYYQPTSEGSHAVDLIISHDADQNSVTPENIKAPIVVDIMGNGVVPCLSIDPNPLDFGEVTVGYSISREVILNSTCGGVVRMEEITWRKGEAPSWLEIDDRGSAGTAVIPPGQFTTFRVTCTPETTGIVGGVGIINVVSNDYDDPITQVEVNCVGVAGSIDIEPDDVEFGPVLIESTATECFQFMNRGSGPLTVQSMGVKGSPVFRVADKSQALLPMVLNGNSSQEFCLEYRPVTRQVDYVDEADLEIVTDNLTDPKHIVGLSGEPVWPQCDFTVAEDPNFVDTIDFGETIVGDKKTRTLNITNNGGYDCIIDSILLGPGTNRAYSFFPPLITPIKPDETFGVYVYYEPEALSDTQVGSLLLNTNDLREEYKLVEFDLEGKGVEPQFDIDPSTSVSLRWDFGDVYFNSVADSKTFIITNTGNGTLKVKPHSWLQRTVEESWVMSAWSEPPLGVDTEGFYQIRDSRNYPDDFIEFTMTFDPKGKELEQFAKYQVESNDLSNPYPKIFMRGNGTSCPDNFYDLDGNPDTGSTPTAADGCEYYCSRPTAQNQVPYEICDGYDNDCNGVVDDTFSINAACDGVGECGAGTLQCRCTPQQVQNGLCPTADLFQTICSSMVFPGDPPDEYCDYLDNDCDGYTDEDFGIDFTCYGKGECGEGKIRCKCDEDEIADGTCSQADKATTICDSMLNAPEDDPCDHLDNNCDGVTDQDEYHRYLEAGEPWEVTKVGSYCTASGGCGVGRWECKDWGTPSFPAEGTYDIYCKPSGGEEDEICDEIDNDCDYVIDNDWNENASGAGCLTGDADVCPDDGVPCCKGMTCVGKGTCANKPDGVLSVYECNDADTDFTRCSYEFGGSEYDPDDPARLEICDGLDNDCDGQTDEGFDLWKSPGIPQTCYGEKGVCATTKGIRECVGAGDPFGVRCSTDPGGSQDASGPEIGHCDGFDNDCDGQTDEDYAIGTGCDGTGACGDGTRRCNSTKDGWCCSSDPSCGGTGGTAEICNGIDDNCDGNIDELWNVGEPCTGRGECADDGQGVYQCFGYNDSRCSTETVFAQPEICDGLDNDCNGLTDDGLGLGDSCDGIGECGNYPGVRACTPVSLGEEGYGEVCCSVNPGCTNPKDQPEECDYLDNDCNGEPDDPFDPVGGNDPNYCGSCYKSCYGAPHVKTPSCESGSCKIISCDTLWRDTNGQFYKDDGTTKDGCECRIDDYDEDGLGNTCQNAVEFPTYNLSDGSSNNSSTVTGNIHSTKTEQDYDWYTFKATDANNGVEAAPYSDKFHVAIELTDPNGEYFFDVYQGTCGSQIICERKQAFRWSTDGSKATSGSSEFNTGEAPCVNIGEQQVLGDHTNNCSNDTRIFFVKVYRIGETGKCGTYTLKASNALYSSAPGQF